MPGPQPMIEVAARMRIATKRGAMAHAEATAVPDAHYRSSNTSASLSRGVVNWRSRGVNCCDDASRYAGGFRSRIPARRSKVWGPDLPISSQAIG